MTVRPDDPLIRAALNDFITRLSACGYPNIFIHFSNFENRGATITSPEHVGAISSSFARLIETARATQKVESEGRF